MIEQNSTLLRRETRNPQKENDGVQRVNSFDLDVIPRRKTVGMFADDALIASKNRNLLLSTGSNDQSLNKG